MAGTSGQVSRLRRVGALVFGGALVLTVLASCSSGTPSPPTVYFVSTVGPGMNMAAPCQLGTVTEGLMIGSVSSGVPTGPHGTTVTCSVTPDGSDFSVSAFVQSTGGSTGAGSFAICPQGCKMPSKGMASGIDASLVFGTSMNDYSDSSCSVTLANNLPGTTTPGFDPADGPAIAPGRVWATVTCNNMMVEGQPGSCQGILTFRLENCTGSPQT